MTRLYWALAALLLASLLGFGVSSCRKHQIHDAAIQAANQQHEQAITQAAQGATHDQAVTNLQPDLDKAKAEVQRLRAKLQAISKPGVAGSDSVPPVGAGIHPSGDAADTPGDGSGLLSVQRELIQAQDVQIKGLEAQVTNLTLSLDSWKGAYEASSRESASLRLAHQAQVAAIQGARWRGRIEGFAVGALSGYVYGRTH